MSPLWSPEAAVVFRAIYGENEDDEKTKVTSEPTQLLLFVCLFRYGDRLSSPSVAS